MSAIYTTSYWDEMADRLTALHPEFLWVVRTMHNRPAYDVDRVRCYAEFAVYDGYHYVLVYYGTGFILYQGEFDDSDDIEHALAVHVGELLTNALSFYADENWHTNNVPEWVAIGLGL